MWSGSKQKFIAGVGALLRMPGSSLACGTRILADADAERRSHGAMQLWGGTRAPRPTRARRAPAGSLGRLSPVLVPCDSCETLQQAEFICSQPRPLTFPVREIHAKDRVPGGGGGCGELVGCTTSPLFLPEGTTGARLNSGDV